MLKWLLLAIGIMIMLKGVFLVNEDLLIGLEVFFAGLGVMVFSLCFQLIFR